MAERKVRFKVFRYKQGRPAPWYQVFTVTVDERTTVLEALQAIRREQDPTLALRHSCHHASCGTCGMRINGRERLACITRVQELGGDEVRVEPLANLPLVTDLVVDMAAFYARYAPLEMPLVRRSEYLPTAEPPEGVAAYTRLENCLECGLCLSACPIMGSDARYLGPAALAAAWRVVEEPRQADPEAALALADTPHGCWRCHVAMACSAVCPAEVDPGGAIMNLRRTIVRRRLGWPR